jgi:phage terminase large subunit-like protein
MTPDQLRRYARDPAAFIDDLVKHNEAGSAFHLLPAQREVFQLAFAFDVSGRLAYDTIVYSCPKKSGKTTLNAALTLWWAYTQEAPNEVLIVANDLEQALARVFNALTGLIRNNLVLARSAEVQSRQILLSNGTKILALASEYAGAAGSNHGFTSWDELWGYSSESSRRLWEELTPVPTRRNSIRFITTYAGFEGESRLLWDLYRQGVDKDEHPEGQAARAHLDLPIFLNTAARLCVYWDHAPRMPWQTPEYYASQRRTLRAGTFLRFHENRWVVAESVFITPELWDGCVNTGRRPLLPSSDHPLFVGVDVGIKHDAAAVVAVWWDTDKLILACHRIWRPSPREPLDLEATVEAYLRELHARYRVREILVDPYQFHRSIMTLKAAAGLRIEEFPQTTGNATRMGQTLFDLLNGRNLEVYPAIDLREHAMNTVAVESQRGFRIAKEKTSKKIDAVVALAMACLAAIEGRPMPLMIYSCHGFSSEDLARMTPEDRVRWGLDNFRWTPLS